MESLSEDELRQACWERGHLCCFQWRRCANGFFNWLDLSLNHALPSSLLVLSSAFTVSGKSRPEEAVVATLSSLQMRLLIQLVLVCHLKILFLRGENWNSLKCTYQGGRKKASERNLESLLGRRGVSKAKTFEKQEQLCKISCALAVLASASIELYNTMLDKEGTDGEEEAYKAYRAARDKVDHVAEVAAADKVSSALIDRVGAMLHELEKEIDYVDAKVGLLANTGQLIYRGHDGKVTPEDVAAAATYLKDTIGKEGVQELISNLSRDREGKIMVEDMVKLAAQTEDADGVEAARLRVVFNSFWHELVML